MTPTARSVARARKAGYLAGVVERWIPQGRRRIDLYGFVDILAIHAGDGVQPSDTLAIQATTGANAAARVAKIREMPEARVWLECGHRIEVHGEMRRVGE